MSPNLNPSRMPCFTQVFTRQPIGLEASGSAARTSPDDSASRRRANAARAVARSADAPAATRDLISVSSMSVTARARSHTARGELVEPPAKPLVLRRAQDERVHSRASAFNRQTHDTRRARL